MTGTTLFRYLARQYLLWLGLVLLGLVGVVYVFEAAELLRRAAVRPEVTPGQMLALAGLKLPNTVQTIWPFIILFAGMLALWRLNRRSELVILRAAGLSVWQFLAPFLVVTLGLGLLNLMALHPLGALLNADYQVKESRLLERQERGLSLSSAGIWLRQDTDTQNILLHAERADMPQSGAESMIVQPVIVIFTDNRNNYLGRMDAGRGILKDGQWILEQVRYHRPDRASEILPRATLPTTLTPERIEDSLTEPNAVSFWDMPAFLESLHAIGFPAVRPLLYYLSLFTQPVLLCAMCLFAAAFSMRLVRRGGLVSSALAGIFLGALAFALHDVTLAFGESQTLPLWLAASAVPIMALCVGIALLLHLEDG